jgi:hypothetical protein
MSDPTKEPRSGKKRRGIHESYLRSGNAGYAVTSTTSKQMIFRGQ